MFGIDDLNLDLENAPENAFEAPDGTYEGVVSAFQFKDDKTNEGVPYKAFIFTLTPDDGGIPYDAFFMLPSETDSAFVQTSKRSALSNFLTGLGIPKSRQDSATEDDVVTGEKIQWELTTTKPNKKGKTYRNVKVRTVGNSSMETARESAPAVSNSVAEDDAFAL